VVKNLAGDVRAIFPFSGRFRKRFLPLVDR